MKEPQLDCSSLKVVLIQTKTHSSKIYYVSVETQHVHNIKMSKNITPLTVLLSFILLRNKFVIFTYHHQYYNCCYECKGHLYISNQHANRQHTQDLSHVLSWITTSFTSSQK